MNSPMQYSSGGQPSTILPSDPSQIARGDVLCSRSSNYLVQDFLGVGAYGMVVKCLKTDGDKTVAVKMIKKDPDSTDPEKQEVAMLTRVRSLDAEKCNIARWGGRFLHLSFACLEFELLDMSLKDLMKKRKYKPLLMKEISNILHQLATACHYLKGIGVIHSDIKTDNVMLVDHLQEPLNVKLIDFGLSCHVTEVDMDKCGGTLCYCSPEMLLGALYDECTDIWSLGCMAVELALGKVLYPGRSVYDMIRYMVEMQGQPPDRVLNSAIRSSWFFVRNASSSQQVWRFKTPEEYAKETGDMSVARKFSPNSLDELKDLIQHQHQEEGPSVTTGTEIENFANLVKQMLEMDASLRITPSQVLQHPFITMDCSQDNFPNNSHVASTTSSEGKALPQSTCVSNNVTNEAKGGTASADEEATGARDIQPEVVVKGRMRCFFRRVMKALYCCCSSTDD